MSVINPRRRSFGSFQHSATAAGRRKKAGSSTRPTRPARSTGDTHQLAMTATNSNPGRIRPQRPSRSGSSHRLLASRQKVSTAPCVIAAPSKEAPPGKVPVQMVRRARKKTGRRALRLAGTGPLVCLHQEPGVEPGGAWNAGHDLSSGPTGARFGRLEIVLRRFSRFVLFRFGCRRRLGCRLRFDRSRGRRGSRGVAGARSSRRRGR